MKISHNLLAINADNFLGISIRKEGDTTEKLSSGYRINRAADDAAGLAISEKMRSQIRGLNQGSRNAQDGISLIQTAEGALNEVHDMLQRINKLSVQAANGSYSTEDRELIQKEIDQLVNEVDGISNNTEFNGIKLLDGSVAGKTATDTTSPLLAVSESGNMTLQKLLDSDSENLNIIYMEETDDFETTTSGAGTATIAGYTYLKDVLQTQIVPQAVTSVISALSPAFNYLSSSSIGIGLKLYTDTSTSTLAAVSVGCSTIGGNVNNSMLTYQLSVNMSSLSYDGSGALTDESRNALETTIVHEMVHGLMDETLTNGMLGITNGVYDTRYTGTQYDYVKSANSYPGWFKEGMAQSVAGGYANCNDWVNNGLGIKTYTSASTIGSIVKNSNNSLTSGTSYSKYGTGYLACMYLGYIASGSSSVTAASITDGLGKVLSDLASGKSLETVISERTNGKYTSLSDFENKFGDADSSSFIYALTQVAGSTGSGGLATGNLADSDLLPNTPATTSLFKLDPTNETVKNIYPSGVNVLSGGGTTTGGTAPVGDYGSTIIDEEPDPPISPGSTIDLSNVSAISGVSYDSTNKVLTITNSGDYTLKGINTTGVRVVVNDGITANVTLNNASINTANGAGISLEGSANVTLNLVGTNSVITSSRYAAGIRVTTGATLSVEGGGTLTAKNVYNGAFDGDGAGIGGADGEDAGNIIINGGTVTAVGGTHSAGIGGGRNGDGGTITINGGNVKANGVYGGAGIGGGADGAGGNITINGGNITADGGNTLSAGASSYAAGIGGGGSGDGGIITITGGTISSKGGECGAGIGSGGTADNGGNITITGGTITAEGGFHAAAIGAGLSSDGGNITITGGIITAKGGSDAAGIGGGLYGAGGDIDINGSGVIVKATGGSSSASNIGGGTSTSGGTSVSGGTVTKTEGIIFEGSSGEVYGDITLGGTLNCDGKTLTVLGGSTLTVLNGGKITNHGVFTNSGVIENHGVIGSVSGTGTTHHYVTGISKNIKEPTTATIGESLSQSISKFSPSTITVAYNGTTRTLAGTWSVKDKDGNPITDLSGTMVADNDSFTYTVTFASQDGIYFDSLNMSMYNMEGANVETSTYEAISDQYVSASGPGGGGSALTYSYVVDSAEAVSDPVVPEPNETGGINIQIGDKANQTIAITIESIKTEDLEIDDLSVLTQDDAKKAMDSCYKAINKVSEIRGTLGAYQNRLEHAMSSIDNTEENLQNSESRIRDMDMAKGMMEYSKYEILIQTGQAMLAQANQQPKSVLALLA